MYKKYEIKRTKIKCGCQSGRKAVTHDSKSDLPLVSTNAYSFNIKIPRKKIGIAFIFLLGCGVLRVYICQKNTARS